MEKAPILYRFPEFSGLWMTVIGMLFWKGVKYIVTSAGLKLIGQVNEITESTQEEIAKANAKAAYCLN